MTSLARDDRARRAFAIENLVRHREVHGFLPNALAAATAQRHGVSLRTVRRWVALGEPASNARGLWTPANEDLLMYFECHGNVAEVHRRRTAVGHEAPSLRQLQRSFKMALTAAERAFAKDGEEGYRRFSVYLRVEQAARNELWQADHVELPVFVTVPRRSGWFKPWMTLFEDCKTRAVTGYAISLQPTAAEVLAAMRAGIVIDPERGPFGGIPAAVLWDNGREFLSEDVTAALADLGSFASSARPYAPHEKGKVERLFRTLNQECLSSLPFYADGPRGPDGRILGFGQDPMTLEELVVRVDEYVNQYNNERVHSAHGMTPRQAWQLDCEPLRVVDEEKLRWMLLGSELRTIRKDGVLWGKSLYFASELHGLVGEEIEVRYMPHDARQIWIFRDGEFLCKAVPQEDVPEDERRAHLGRRAKDRKRVKQLHQSARRRERAHRHERRGRIEPITKPAEVVDTVEPVSDRIAERPKRYSKRSLDSLGISRAIKPLEDE